MLRNHRREEPMPDQDAGTKNMTLRLDVELAERVQALADVEDQSVSDVVREAIAAHVERRRRDPKFQKLLEENLNKHARLLKMLAEG
jgi:Ribbon-helix-helix protein, copG family